ncbi:MAG: ABC transporter ATP-binding protein [Leptospiraceae bacterium]|nr:ABC transporter ATP-binding protein [Leptospiraceae bacterium]MDW8306286.1 ABC transporter ATP-binding protein [Leptospiraceae bacterium]
MAKKVVRFENLGRRFSGKFVFRHLNGVVEEGERIFLLGENGQGKTTLVQIFAEVLRPSEGLVHIAQISRGFISHEPMFYPQLSAWENLLFFMHLAGVSMKQERIKDVLFYFGLYERRHDIPAHFSKGMLQRLAWARLVLCQSEFLLLDEPFSSLDNYFRPKLVQALEQGGIDELSWRYTTLVLVEHQEELVARLGKRVWILHEGRLSEMRP